MEIKWKEEYSVGFKEIDDQHKHFISLLNELYSSVTSGKSRQEMKCLFEKLSNYAETHFSTEEKYFDEFHYAEAQEHKAKHQGMRDEIEKIKKQEEGNEIDYYGNIVYFLQEWLDDHLKKIDQKYVACFKENGVI